MSAPKYTDEYLNVWADVYVEYNLQKRGVKFCVFLEAPYEILYAIKSYPHTQMWPLFQPLLPEQRAVQKRVDKISDDSDAELLKRPGCTVRDGAIVEPLHHRSISVNQSGGRARV